MSSPLDRCSSPPRPSRRKEPRVFVYYGQKAEAFVGIQLLAANPDQSRSLFIWTREGGAKSNAEVDFLVSTPEDVLPIEVKSGASGSLKSLHQFLASSHTKSGLRLCSSPQCREVYVVAGACLYVARVRGDASDLALFEHVVASMRFPADSAAQ